jgi:hypothetical protein
MADHTETVPQLPPASVDFNALNDACRDGLDHAKILDAALIADTVALSADEAATRAAESVAAAPSVAGLNKVDLLEIGENETVAYARDRDGNVIPFADATNDQMREAIEAKRAGQPIEASTTSDVA